VALVLLVSVLIGTVTTLAMRHYLTARLDDEVQDSMRRTLDAFRTGGPEGPGPRLGTQVGTVTAILPSSGPGRGWLADERHEGGAFQSDLEERQLESLSGVPTDMAPHEVEVEGLGEYRAVAQDFGGTTVVTALPTADVDDVLENLIWWEVLLALLAVAGAAGTATYVVRRQLRPLRQVASTAHTVAGLPRAEGEIAIAPRVPAELTDERTEVGQVGYALNTLLVHVEKSLAERHRSEQQVRQFVADASHELRTPLTTIAGYTELARRRPDDDATIRTALGKVEEESARMTSMVEDLLLLARLDSGRPLARDTVDLSRLLVEAVSDARVVAPDHRWQLDLPEESIEVTGDGERLHQVVTNLLANARKHTPAGTTVTVTGTRAGGLPGFSVHDDGPGFPSELADSAFERFVRGDVARTRATASAGGFAETGGAGLGLALVSAIVSAHGGTVSLDSRPGSTTVSVALPG
jgi:two-component system OmpR family sensor kinase